MDELLPIGRFARAARLSVKQLRHYDELGLLRPARVDEVTGYRYYQREQVRSAVAIALLRSLDVSLATIADVLQGERDALVAERVRLETEVERRRGALRALERILDEGLLRHEVGFDHEPARHVVAARGRSSAETVGADSVKLIDELMARVGDVGPVIGVYPVDLAPAFDIAVCVEVEAGTPGAEPLPGGPVAIATHVGTYDELPLAYHALFARVNELGHEPGTAVQEHYLTDPTTTAPERNVTRVLLTLKEEAT